VTWALRLLGVLGALSVLASDLPRPLAWPPAAAALAWGLYRARAEAARPACTLVWPSASAPALDGTPLRDARLHWRGPLAFLRWRDADGRSRCLGWWPDTLAASARRELRLAAEAAAAAARARSVAP
jgi:toxin CptA